MPTGISYKITVSPSVCRLQKADVTKKKWIQPFFFFFLFKAFDFHFSCTCSSDSLETSLLCPGLLSNSRLSSVQFSSVPWPIGSSGGGGGTWKAIQQRSFSSLVCGRLSWALLTLKGRALFVTVPTLLQKYSSQTVISIHGLVPSSSSSFVPYSLVIFLCW